MVTFWRVSDAGTGGRKVQGPESFSLSWLHHFHSFFVYFIKEYQGQFIVVTSFGMAARAFVSFCRWNPAKIGSLFRQNFSLEMLLVVLEFDAKTTSAQFERKTSCYAHSLSHKCLPEAFLRHPLTGDLC